MGAFRHAQLEPDRSTPCSKYYALKLHWSRSWLKPKKIEITHCPTKAQTSNFMTKLLRLPMFKTFSLLLMGW